MEPKTITQRTAAAPLAAGVASGEYRYVTDPESAAAALRWMLAGAGGSRMQNGTVVGIDLETTSLRPADGRIRLAQVAS